MKIVTNDHIVEWRALRSSHAAAEHSDISDGCSDECVLGSARIFRRKELLPVSKSPLLLPVLTSSFSLIRRRFSARLTALNLANIAAIIRLMMAHVAETMSNTKKKNVYSDMTVCVNLKT